MEETMIYVHEKVFQEICHVWILKQYRSSSNAAGCKDKFVK